MSVRVRYGDDGKEEGRSGVGFLSVMRELASGEKSCDTLSFVGALELLVKVETEREERSVGLV